MKDNWDIEIVERQLRRICGEFLEMPGLRLTREQARRFWGLDEQTCVRLLDFLVEGQFLHRTGDGRFARTEGMTSCLPLRMAKATLQAMRSKQSAIS
jgi:hypothetical protein